MCERRVCFLSCMLVLVAVSAALGDLVGYWKLDENGGTKAADSSGRNNNGTILGGASWVPGKAGSALYFDGVDDYVNCGNDASLDITGKITISIWIQPAVAGEGGWNAGPIAKADAAAGWSWQLRYNAPGGGNYMGFQFNANPGGSTWVSVNQNLLPGEWCHIAGTFNGKDVICYLNGLEASRATMAAITAGTCPLYIGQEGWLQMFKGVVDELKIYNHALTADEVAEICPPPRIAKEPDPADGAIAVVMPLLRWKAGYKAMFHEVYLGTSPDLGPANFVPPRTPALMCYYAPGFQPGTTYYWRVDEIEADGKTVHTGNVWSFTTQALTAYRPDPPDGTNGASVAPTLAWLPGQAAVQHHVYFGTSLDAVTQGAADVDKGVVAETTFAPGALESTTTYYWRVDEVVAGGAVKTGAVWSFTTCLPVDDFESYTDEEGGRIFDAWIDGWTNGNSGSQVGYAAPPYAERAIVHGGLQSMPLDYNNVDAPFYSEAEREFAPVQDWTVSDVNVLVLDIRGNIGNAPAPLYVTLEDASKNKGTAVYADAAALAGTKWVEWKIPLSVFTDAGVNATRIKKIYIGVGDRDNPAPGGKGLIYIDDIRVSK